jgi:hypothetical protein|tara:strand:+ start:670 stop:2658 length:1989 start_codon:yes stop_codon:yes gene_type:complete
MTYSVQNTDGSKTINVAASQVNSSFSVALVGRNVSGYGQYFVQNSIRHLENFASTSAPTPDIPLEGQIWYDKTEDVMRVYDGTGWQRQSITVSAAAPSGGVASGTAYYDTVDDKLKVHNGTTFVDSSYAGKVSNEYSGVSNVGSPSSYGTRLRSMYVPGEDGIFHSVMALMYVNDGSNGLAGFTGGESIMAIFSDHASFTVQANTSWKIEGLADTNMYAQMTDSDGIGDTIKPGMNLRTKYASTAIALANVATQADRANAILTGAGEIDANIIIHSGKSYVPTTTDNETLGAAGSRFSEVHTDTIFIGNPASATAQYIKKAKTGGSTSVVLDIGESDAPIDNIYVSNITLANGGTISGLNIETFGSNTAAIDEVWASNVIVNEGNVWTNNLGFYGDLRNPTTGNIVVDVSGDAVITTTGVATVSNKTFGSDILVTDNSINIGNAGTKVGTVHSSTFSGVDATLSGTVSGGTVTDGSLSSTSGTITGGVAATFSGAVTGGSLTDGTATITSGNLTGGVTATFSGNVAGDHFNGTATSAQFADLAEIYSSDVDYDAGTVVKIGGDAEITQTTGPEDTEVFGVVSTTPAYLMNSGATGIPVALAGRVPVNVIGLVNKGQRLTSSDVSGIACAANDDTPLQAIIGRSLEDKTSEGQGVVEAVIGVK